jgi:hypothetical protein
MTQSARSKGLCFHILAAAPEADQQRRWRHDGRKLIQPRLLTGCKLMLERNPAGETACLGRDPVVKEEPPERALTLQKAEERD